MSSGPAPPACRVCGGAAAACCPDLSHTGDDGNDDDLNSRAVFSVFPVVGHHHHHHHHHHHEHRSSPCLHEFQFFGQQKDDDHQESIAWLFDHPPPPPRELRDDDGGRSPADDPFGALYRHPRNGNGLTVEVDARLGLGRGGAARQQMETAAASATIMSFCGSTFTDAASSRLKEPAGLIDSRLQIMPVEHDQSTEREVKLMRYKKKRMRRCYDKKIRYASRKAYAQTRPRVTGRFAKVFEADDA